jgi:hypothetical protein
LRFELRIAAPWADCVRSVVHNSDGSFKYAPDPHHPEFRVSCTSFETPVETARMEDYVRRNWDNCTFLPGHGCHETYHFADVAIQRDRYDRAYTGTSDHDIVSAINAAILVLQDLPPPAPFSIKDKKEALFLLAHFVGDLHQPLHVGAIYLDSTGKRVDPDQGFDPSTETAGGNLIRDQNTNLHTEWDQIPPVLGRAASPSMVHRAKAIASTNVQIGAWPAAWASDTVIASHSAFAGLSFAGDGPHHWLVSFDDHAKYLQAKNSLQRGQLAKAGARLAELLNAIWP